MLALSFNRPDVDAFLSELSAEDYLGWWDYYQLEPWGTAQHALHSGIHSALVANMQRTSKSKGEPFKPLDFMPPCYSNNIPDDVKKPKVTEQEVNSAKLKALFMNMAANIRE